MRLDLSDVTCENCLHREVCGKRENMEDMLTEIRKIIGYSKYKDFTLYVDCKFGIQDNGMVK